MQGIVRCRAGIEQVCKALCVQCMGRCRVGVQGIVTCTGRCEVHRWCRACVRCRGRAGVQVTVSCIGRAGAVQLCRAGGREPSL